VHSALEHLDAVTIFKVDTCKFKCSVHTPHGTIQFHICVYQDAGEHIVEIQRRSGCGVGFSMIYRNLLHSLEHLQSNSTFTTATLADPMQSSVQLSDPHLATLIAMVDSPYIDIQCEGLSTLSHVSETNDNAEILLTRSAMATVCSHLGSENITCQIAATRIVANISKVADFERVDGVEFEVMLRNIINTLTVVMTTVAVAELQRQSCIALAALSTAFATEIVAKNGRKALGHITASSNPVLAHEAQQALAMLNRAGFWGGMDYA
jgi:hypothetical protein